MRADQRYSEVQMWRDSGETFSEAWLAVWCYAKGSMYTLEPDGCVKRLAVLTPAGNQVDQICWAPTSGMLRRRVKP